MFGCKKRCLCVARRRDPTGATGPTGPTGATGPGSFDSIMHYADLWVDKTGNDTTGTGTFSNPFLTIPAAIAAADDTSMRYIIHVGSGVFSEDFSLVPWVNIKGVHKFNSLISGIVSLDDSGTWTGSLNYEAALSDLTFTNAIILDFSLPGVESEAGRCIMYDCTFENLVTLVGYMSLNQIHIEDCTFSRQNLWGLTLTGIDVTLNSTSFLLGTNIAIQLALVENLKTTFTAYGGASSGNMVVMGPPSVYPDNGITLNLVNFAISGSMDLDGPEITTNATADSLPHRLNLFNLAPLPNITTVSAGSIHMFSGSYQSNLGTAYFTNTLLNVDAWTVPVNYPISPARLVQNLSVRVLNNTLTSDAVITVMQDDNPTSLSVTIPAGSSGTFENNTNLLQIPDHGTMGIRITSESDSGSASIMGTILLL